MSRWIRGHRSDYIGLLRDPTLCREGVYTPEQLRRAGRGKSGFERHYIYHQCTRKPRANGYCFQHQPEEGKE